MSVHGQAYGRPGTGCIRSTFKGRSPMPLRGCQFINLCIGSRYVLPDVLHLFRTTAFAQVIPEPANKVDAVLPAGLGG